MSNKGPEQDTSVGRRRLPAFFYRTEAGGEPVREWLKELSPEDRKKIGEDIKTADRDANLQGAREWVA